MAGVFRAAGAPPATGIVVGFIAGTAVGALFAPLVLLGLPIVISGLVVYPALIMKPGSRYMVAVSEDKNTVSQTFARAPYFVIIDNEQIIDTIENPYKDALPAGPPAVDLAASYKVDEVVAGNFGRTTLELLHEKGIKPISYSGTIDELIHR